MAKLVVFALLLAVCHHSADAETGIELFAKINAIKQLADETYFPSMELENAKKNSLGDTAVLLDGDTVSEVEEHRSKDAHAEGLLAKASALLERIKPSKNLGEAHANIAEVDHEFPKITHSNPARVAETVSRVVSYWGNLAHDGKRLSQSKLDEARKWYIDTTALVLGRYAYDDTEFKMGAQKAHDVSGLKSRAVAAKKSMDRMDAARHMHKMGQEKLINHSRINVLKLIERTGRLAAFLSEIEDTRSIGEMQKAKKLHEHISKLSALQERESEITDSINELMRNIAHGDPITGKTNKQITAAAVAKQKAVASNAGKELAAQLDQAADKEDKARIVEVAGRVAEKKIMSTMNKALAEKPKKKKKVSHVIPMSKVRPMVEVRNDLAVPLHTLHNHVTRYLNHKLGHVLKLFNKRHKQHKHLTTSEHKRVGSTLRHMAAHLMQKFSSNAKKVVKHKKKRAHWKHKKKRAHWKHKKKRAHWKKQPQHEVQPIPKAPHKKKKAPDAATTWSHKGAVAKEKKAMAAGNAEAPSQFGPGTVSPKSVVDKFIWHTLGKHGAMRTSPPQTLAELLKNGVNLMNGGRLHFVMRP